MSEVGAEGSVLRWGRFFFQHRSYTAIPLALVLVSVAQVTPASALWGSILIAVGEIIRLAAVRASGKITRTRNVGARELVTWGLYSYTRNPLYIGNFIIWIGAAVFAGGPLTSYLLIGVILFFLLQYSLIVNLEEATLLELFGEAYEEYRRFVPRVWPRLITPPISSSSTVTALHPWAYAFQSERSTLYSITGVIIFCLASTWLKS